MLSSGVDAKSLLRAAVAAAAAASAAGGAEGSGDAATIYSAKFTSSPLQEDVLSTISECESDVTCAGVSFEPNGTVSTSRLLRHSFVGEYGTERTYGTKKDYTYHRGRIVGGEVIRETSRVTLARAKALCTETEGCAAFTYPVRSAPSEHVGLNELSNVTFFSTLEEFVPDDSDGWRTYVSNDASRISHGKVNADALPYDESVSDRPYRGCCREGLEVLPSIAEVTAADSLERISCDISREEFFLRYELPRKPVMLVGCERDWPAARDGRWLKENLATRFSNHTKWRARIGGEKYLNDEDYRHEVPWSDISEAMLTGKAYYIFDQLLDPEAKVIDDDYSDPKPVAGADLYAKLPYFEGPFRWFCHGPRGTGTQSHMDPAGTDAWNTVIKGHKWWVLYPPGFTDNDQLSCEESCSVEEPLVFHWYANVGMHGARTEFLPDKYAQHVLQRPGETIYVPDGLLHSVLNLDETIAITKNFASAANLDEVWMETVTDGDPAKWRAMYYQTLNREQRRRVRASQYWPPHRWEEKPEPEGEDPSEGGGECTSGPEDVMEEYPMFLQVDYDYEFEVGEVVEALFNGDDEDENEKDPDNWNVGQITAFDPETEEFTVAYNDADVDHNLKFWHLRRLPKEGDVVEGRYNGQHNEWYKATVTGVHFDLNRDVTFDVRYADGDADEGLPRHAVRSYVPPQDDEIVQVLWGKDDNGEDVWHHSIVAGEENSDGTYNVEGFDGREREEVPLSEVRRFLRTFEVGDKVAAELVVDMETDESAWYRGVVARKNRNGRYDVKLQDGDGNGSQNGDGDGDRDEVLWGYCIGWRSMRPLWASDGVLGLGK